ncbi:MAG: TRAP transporter small permease [Burkholderiales bacterium]
MMEKIDLPGNECETIPKILSHGAGKLVRTLTTVLACAGALVLFAMAIMSVTSIFGRVVFSKPIQGDYELAQVMVAAAVALFLPYCHMRRAHIFVDFFTAKFSSRVRHGLDALAGLLLALCAALLTVQLTHGMFDMREAGEQTMILGFPVWIAYIALVVSFAVLAITAAFLAWTDLSAARRPA